MIWFSNRSQEISKQAENTCSGACLRPGSSSRPLSRLPPSQQLSLTVLGTLVEPSWRWIFPGSHQRCCLICHFVQWIKAISCSTLKPRVHFMNNSCKQHFRSCSSKVTAKGHSWDVQKKKKNKGAQIVCKVDAWGCFCELLRVGGRAEQTCAWHKATSAASLVSLCPFTAQTSAGRAFATTVSPRARCHPVRPISAGAFQSTHQPLPAQLLHCWP